MGIILPKNPETVLIAIMKEAFGLKAVGICNKAKQPKQLRYNILLPKVSEKGARTSGPMPSMTT